MTHRTMSERSYHGATSRSEVIIGIRSHSLLYASRTSYQCVHTHLDKQG